MNQIRFTITTKEKIKRIRLHRHMKKCELGELVGFTDGAANRIAQYESGFRVPKEDMVKKIAAALNVAECALLEPDTGNLEGIMETLFWLDEDMPDVLRCSLTMPFDKIQAEADSNIVPIIHTNARTSPFNAQPTMLWSENDLLNCLFNTYAVMQYRYHTGKITHEKYFEWKLQWSFGSTITHSSPLPKDIDALLQNSNED